MSKIKSGWRTAAWCHDDPVGDNDRYQNWLEDDEEEDDDKWSWDIAEQLDMEMLGEMNDG